MKVLVNGQLIEYKDEGKGKVIVLLHGWGSSLKSFDETATYLSKKYRVIRFDFPGFGSSPKPDDSWGVGEYADLTAAFLKKIKVESIHALIGHSFGGRVIVKGIATSLLQADKVVLLGAAGIKPERSLKKLFFTAAAKTGKVVTSLPGLRRARSALREKLYASAGSTDYLRAEKMRSIFLNTINEDLLPLMKKVTSPTLMLWGENDDEVPVRDAERMQAEIPNSVLVVIPGAGHFVFLDDSAAVKKELQAFL